MAQSGSFWATAVNVLAAAGNEKACSIASARSNSPWTPALQATGKCTFPKSSRAFAGGTAIASQKTITDTKPAVVRKFLSIHQNVLISGPHCFFFPGESAVG